jgi:preprotein translocase subunit SecA
MEIIRIFSVDPEMTEKQFAETNINNLTDKMFAKIEAYYNRKLEAIAHQTFPVLRDVLKERGDQIENIVVPFTDGIRSVQVAANLKKAVDSNGYEVFKAFEKTVVLALIDDAWKEHLREMDDLKQSVQNAVYEQKDPLIVYKMEAFNMFKQMLATVNKDIVSFLFKGNIPSQDPAQVREARPQQRQDLSKLKVSKPELAQSSNGVPVDDTRELQKTQPIRVENKIGRNDPCPCGSGKKYKNCHGIGAE